MRGRWAITVSTTLSFMALTTTAWGVGCAPSSGASGASSGASPASSGASPASSTSAPAEDPMFKRSKKAIAAEGLVVALRPGPSAASVIMRVTNPTSSTRTFCDYHTPFEGLRNNIFTVMGSDGAVLDYRGMMAKRAPPNDDDFLDVAAGGVVESPPLDLADGYALTTGTWQVVFPGNGISGLPSSSPLTLIVP